MRIALATCKDLPEPDPDHEIVLDALERHGLRAEPCVWSDASVDWAAFSLCVLRTTWDYYRARDAFLMWLTRVESVTRVQNEFEIVRWNSHKSYLVELGRRGFNVAPTRLLRRGVGTRLQEVLDDTGWREVVIKPAISASSYQTRRIEASDVVAGEHHMTRLLKRGDVLVQQYLPSVHDSGERALVFIDGELTHSVCKRPRFHGEDESVEGPLPVQPEEEELATALMAGPGRGTLYGRVDLARDFNGNPCLMELELIEPSLFFLQHPPALERFAAAVSNRVRESRR